MANWLGLLLEACLGGWGWSTRDRLFSLSNYCPLAATPTRPNIESTGFKKNKPETQDVADHENNLWASEQGDITMTPPTFYIQNIETPKRLASSWSMFYSLLLCMGHSAVSVQSVVAAYATRWLAGCQLACCLPAPPISSITVPPSCPYMETSGDNEMLPPKKT